MTVFFPLGELIDRYVIAKLKLDRTQNNQLEFEFYQEQVSFINLKSIDRELAELYNVHCQIWDLESQLKSGLEDQLPLEEIGRRAITIRDWNRKRVILKNVIAEILSDPIREIKKDHLSQ